MQAEKKQWPEVVGKTGNEAKELILQDDATIQVQLLPTGSPCTRDFRINRVRVFINEQQVVVEVPHRG